MFHDVNEIGKMSKLAPPTFFGVVNTTSEGDTRQRSRLLLFQFRLSPNYSCRFFVFFSEARCRYRRDAQCEGVHAARRQAQFYKRWFRV